MATRPDRDGLPGVGRGTRTRGGDPQDDLVIDVDLLAYNGQHVYCIECKSNASTLRDEQLEKLIRFADSVDARPGVASFTGKISTAQHGLLEERTGVLLGSNELLRA